MNPWSLVIIGIGVMLIIVGVKGTYENVAHALTSHQSASTTAKTQPSTGFA